MGVFTQQLASSKSAEEHLFLRQMPNLAVITSWKQYFIIFAMFCLFDMATRSSSDPMGANPHSRTAGMAGRSTEVIQAVVSYPSSYMTALSSGERNA